MSPTIAKIDQPITGVEIWRIASLLRSRGMDASHATYSLARDCEVPDAGMYVDVQNVEDEAHVSVSVHLMVLDDQLWEYE